MKMFFAMIALAISLPALADSPEVKAPKFSAFTHQNKLIVTMLGDCNHKTLQLDVEDSCDKDRLTRNAAPICHVTIRVAAQTVMGCPEIPDAPQISVIDLASTQVDPHAHTLVIHQPMTLPVKVHVSKD